jgi:hypothetical protein
MLPYFRLWHETDLASDLATSALESTTDVACNALVFGNQKFKPGRAQAGHAKDLAARACSSTSTLPPAESIKMYY